MLKKYFTYLRNRAVRIYEHDICNFLQPHPKAKLLDIGCDDGKWTMTLAHKIGTSHICGIEIIDEAIKKAIKKGIRITKANIEHTLPYKANTFDIIHANQVIEHLHRTEHFVKEIYRILKPGGYAIICTENLASWHNIISLLFGWMPMSSSNFSQVKYNIGNPLAIHSGEDTFLPESWQHIRVLTTVAMREIFQLHGFHVESIKGAGYYPFPAWFARIDKRHAAFITGKFIKPRTR